MSADVVGLTKLVRARGVLVARAWIGGKARRGTLAIDANIRAGKTQTRVVIRASGQPDVVLYDRLIAAGGVEIKVGHRYVEASELLASAGASS